MSVLASIAFISLLLSSNSPRTTINLDQDWQFMRVRPTPISKEFPDEVSKTGWRIVSVSSEETRRDKGQASNAIDGDVQSFWHSRWSTNPAQYPHEIVIDLGRKVKASAFQAIPRQGIQNGLPKSVEVYLSDDLKAWGAPATSGSFSDSFVPIELKFSKILSGRYLRFVAKTGHDGFCVLAELGLAKPISAQERSSWNSQYNIENINFGADKYDLSGLRLELTKAREWAHLEASTWEHVSLPHTAHLEGRDAKVIWQGVCYYRRSLPPGMTFRGQLVELTLNGAMQVSDLWLNGKHIGGRRGGYLPVKVDLTHLLKPNSKNELLVRLDCRDNPLVPPGKAWRELDFSYYSGLYRDAFLTVTPQVHITDPLLVGIPKSGGVFVTFPIVRDAEASIKIATHIANESHSGHLLSVAQSLLDSHGSEVGHKNAVVELNAHQSISETQELTIKQPRLWSPDAPNLYTLRTTVSLQGKVMDQLDTPVGIRSISFSREKGLILNGKPIRLVGTNRHQEYPFVGNALSRNMSFRDIRKIKEAGFNCVRLSHYPQDPSVMDACDQLGVLAIPATAGWQFVNRDERFMRQVDSDIHDLVRWHRNHPSILMWEASLNETYVGPLIAKRWNDAAHAEFDGPNFFTVGDSGEGQPWDMAYNGWNDQSHSRPQSGMPQVPGYIREYGDYEFGGEASTTRISRSQGESAELQAAWNFAWSHNMNRGNYPWTIGDGTWVMYDYIRGCSPTIERSGIEDHMRVPRFSTQFFQSQRDPYAPGSRPLTFIASYWTPRTTNQKVVVFSNCETVELRLNGKTVAIQKPDHGPDTPYGDYNTGGTPWDGGNCLHLAHPAFTFLSVRFHPGELVAIGRIHGRAVTRSSVRTPGKPVSLRLRADLSGRPLAADGSDAIFIYADVIDGNGSVLRSESRCIQFSSTRGSFLSGNSVNSEAGIAANLFKAGLSKGSILIHARTKDGLTGDLRVTAN